MTTNAHEYVSRQLKNARLNLKHAKDRRRVTETELFNLQAKVDVFSHLLELVVAEEAEKGAG
jgi:hypothetical protein